MTPQQKALDHVPDAGKLEAWAHLLVYAPQASEPAGWKLVPVEPTPEMLALLNPHLNLTPVSRYAAMLAAAPEATK